MNGSVPKVSETRPGPAAPAPRAADRPGVLIVDDERNVRAMLTSILSDAGFRCHEAADAEGALEILGRRKLSLGILDLALPGMSGAELAWRIRQHRPEMPLVALSGQLKGWDTDDLKDLGFARIFSKPMDCDEFVRTCREVGGGGGGGGAD